MGVPPKVQPTVADIIHTANKKLGNTVCVRVYLCSTSRLAACYRLEEYAALRVQSVEALNREFFRNRITF